MVESVTFPHDCLPYRSKDAIVAAVDTVSCASELISEPEDNSMLTV